MGQKSKNGVLCLMSTDRFILADTEKHSVSATALSVSADHQILHSTTLLLHPYNKSPSLIASSCSLQAFFFSASWLSFSRSMLHVQCKLQELAGLSKIFIGHYQRVCFIFDYTRRCAQTRQEPANDLFFPFLLSHIPEENTFHCAEQHTAPCDDQD